MQVVAQPFRTHVARAAITAAGLMALLNARPESTRLAEAAAAGGTGGTVARKLILSDQARRYLALQYRSYPTEFMGCMIGEAHGGAVVVRRIAPADVDRSEEHTSELQSHSDLVCRLLLEKKKKKTTSSTSYKRR